MIEIVLEDEADIPAADTMIAVMYGVPDALQDIEQQVILRMALLANKYDAPKVLSTAVQHLTQQQTLDADALELFWKLPGCWEQPFWPLVLQAVQHKLSSTGTGAVAERLQAVTELLLYVCDRDLEAVWADSSSMRRDLLMSLPVEVLAAFLQSSELRVISEDTVLYTVVKHTEALMQVRPPLTTAVLDEQRQQLMSAVRLPHLSYAGLSYIAPALPWLSQQECLKAAFVRGATASRVVSKRARYPAQWLLGPRGSSPKTSHDLEFSASLASVQEACNQVLEAAGIPHTAGSLGSEAISLTCSSSSAFAGREWKCRLSVGWEEGGVALGVFVGPRFPMLSRAAMLEVPWVPKDMRFRLGSVSLRLGGEGHVGRALRGTGNVVGPMSSADAWEAPPWAEGDKVVVRATVYAHNIL